MVALSLYYVRWHYTRGVKDLLNIVLNFLWFFNEFFSIRLLLSTLFAPFQRLHEESHGFHPSEWIQAKMVNAMMRFVGALARLFLILIGLFFILLTVVLGALFLLAWVAAPILMLAAVFLGPVFVFFL